MENVIYDFKLAGREYNPVVMWFWQDITTKKEIKFQLSEFKKMGIYEYFIHPMFGLRNDYLSDEFMELVAYSVSEAKRLGMHFWIYDEYNWPSGTAGGKMLELYPWTKGKLLRRYQSAVGSFQTVDCLASGSFFKCFTEDVADGAVEFRDVTKEITIVCDGEASKVTYKNDSMGVTVLDFYFIEDQDTPLASSHWAKGLNEVHGYLDTFNPKAVRQYIEMTHERYKKYIGCEFGKTVRGVFTDETTMCAVGDIIKSGAVVFNPSVTKEFQKRYGYDLATEINWLFFPCSTEKQKRVRNDFWNLVTDLYCTNFIGQMSAWCKKNGLLFTGHFGGEEHLQWSLMETGDMQKALTHLDRPGMDSILSSKFIENSNFNNAGKLVSSVAKYMGRDRVLCETYTLSGWDTHLDLMKRIANRVVTMGGNFIQYMGAYYSLNGNRKEQPMGYPPSHSYNNPLAKYYKTFGEYIGAMQYLSAVTKPAGRVLIVAPLTHIKQGIDLAHMPTSFETEAKQTDDLYEHLINALLACHIEFDIVSEFMLSSFENAGGSATIGSYSYDAVIFPRTRDYDEKIAAFVRLLAATTAEMIFINGFLDSSVDGSDAGLDPAKLRKIRASAKGAELYRYDGLNVYSFVKENADVLDLKMQLLPLLGADKVSLGIETKGTVYTSLRACEDFTVCFIDNDENKPVKVTLDAVPGMKLVSPVTREERPFTVSDGRVSLTLNEYELVAAVIDRHSHEPVKSTKKALDIWSAQGKKCDREISLDNFSFTPENNVFVCDFDYRFERVGGSFKKCMKHTMFADRERILMGDRYTAKSSFVLNGYKGRLELFTETECIKKLTLNGTELKTPANFRLWGPENCKLDISALVKDGVNEIVIEGVIPKYSSYHTVPNTMLFGDFALDSELNIIPFNGKAVYGDFAVQGFPYCTGNVRYGFTFNGSASEKAFAVVDTNDAFTVYFNGEEISKVLWKPGVVELCGVKDGKNELVIETSSPYGNLMGEKTVNGILSPVTIKFFE